MVVEKDKRLRNTVQSRFTDVDIERMNALIEKGLFDNKAQIIRRAIHEFLDRQEKPIFA